MIIMCHMELILVEPMACKEPVKCVLININITHAEPCINQEDQ